MSLLLIERLEAGSTLTRPGAEALMEEVLAGRIAPPEMVRLLTALNRRPVQVQELAGFARVMRRHATRVFVDGEVGDRKSTRLNSSHVAISYAVFCLKKKKKRIHMSEKERAVEG